MEDKEQNNNIFIKIVVVIVVIFIIIFLSTSFYSYFTSDPYEEYTLIYLEGGCEGMTAEKAKKFYEEHRSKAIIMEKRGTCPE